MAIVGSKIANTLYGFLSAKGMVGPKLMSFCQTFGNGSQMSIVGKAFTTTDAGSIPGAGVGVGTGITGLVASAIQGSIVSHGTSKNFKGPKFPDFAEAIGKTIETEMAQATLSSTHTPVFVGAGTVDKGSYTVTDSEWAGNIQTLGSAAGFLGPKWPDFCEVVGKGIVLGGFKNATGAVTISGTFAGPVPPGPVPGAGVGTGVVS